MESKTKDLSGETFGKLTAVDLYHNPNDPGRTYWRCVCSCDNPNRIRVVRADRLHAGATKQCLDCSAQRSGRPKGTVNTRPETRFRVETHVGRSYVAGSRHTCSALFAVGNPVPLFVLEPSQRKDGPKGYPPGTTKILNRMMEMGLVPQRGEGLLTPWVRRNGVEFHNFYYTSFDEVDTKYKELMYLTPDEPEEYEDENKA